MCDKQCACDKKCEPRVPSRDEYRDRLDALIARIQDRSESACLLEQGDD